MRAVVVQKFGPPEVLQPSELPDPQPGPRQVLIRVAAIGINFADLFMRMGMYPRAPHPPFVPGLELAGIVESVGAEVTEGFKEGDRVLALSGNCGGYATKIAVSASQVFNIPAGLTFAEAAALPVNYLTAWHSMFEMGNLRSGDRVLIHGAAGGVGIAAVQLAQTRGIVTIGSAGPAKQKLLAELGVDYCIDHNTQNFLTEVRKIAPDGIEMVLDPIGGETLARSYACLGQMGRLVIYGMSSAVQDSGRRSVWRMFTSYLQMPKLKPLKIMSENKAIIGVSLGRLSANVIRREMQELVAVIGEYGIRPRIGKTYPLEEAAEAHRYIHSRQSVGKVILLVQ
jgi:synaptic vesicle membrane protein VAT-1